jgi:hypothetical protein
MALRLNIFLCTLMTLCWSPLAAIEEATAKGMFACKITSFVQWKEDKEKIIIAVAGYGETAKLMLNWKELSIGKLKLIFIPFALNSTKVTPQFDVLYIGKDVPQPSQMINQLPPDQSLLIVGEGQKMLNKGSIVAVYLRHDKLKFSVNQRKLLARGMKIRANVLRLAEKVILP